MKNTDNKLTSCGHEEKLVAFLYGEATADEARNFTAHAQECHACREDLASFGLMRNEVRAWRDEAIGATLNTSSAQTLSTPAQPTAILSALENAQMRSEGFGAQRSRSAVAALREFFSLSPLWLRAAGFATGLAICALLALAAINSEVRWDTNGFVFHAGLTRNSRDTVAPTRSPSERLFTHAEVAEIIAARDSSILERDAALQELEMLRTRAEDAEEQAALVIEASAPAPNDSRMQRRNTQPSSTENSTRRNQSLDPERRTRPYSIARDDDALRLPDLLGEGE